MYLCSLLTTTDPLNINHGEMQEATLDMVPTGRTILLRIQTDDGQTAFGHTNFVGSQQMRNLMSNRKQLYLIRGVYPIGRFREPPVLFRIYVSEEFKTDSTSHFVENEETLMDLLQAFIGRIIHESPRQLALAKDANEWEPSKVRHFPVPCKRNLSPEQRSAAQEMLGAITPKRFEIGPSIELKGHYLDLDKWVFDNKDTEQTPWTQKVGFVSGSHGCGRRRAYAAAMGVIAAGQMSFFPCSLSRFNAYRMSAVVCKKESIEKWVQELADIPTYIIEKEEDCDQLSLSNMENGGVILFATDFSWADQQEEDACSALRESYNNNTVPRNLSPHQLARLHSSLKMKEAKAVVRWIQFRMLLLDDGVDFQSEGPENFNLSLTLQADWTWIHMPCSPNPSHIPLAWIKNTEIFMNIPQQSEVYSFDLTQRQPAPKLFSLLDSTYIRMKIPGAILRKVTLMPVSVRANESEIAFMDTFRRIQQSLSTTPLPPIDFSACLLGALVEDTGLSMSSLISRIHELSHETISADLAIHFARKGTVAQRILESGAIKMNVHFPQTLVDGEFPINVHSQRSAELGTCPVCACDDSNVMSTCGHTFCSNCVSMLRRGEVRQGTTQCPTCRAALSAYDWWVTGTGQKVISSKMAAMSEVLQTIFSRRRQKKRLGMLSLVFAPESACDDIRRHLAKDYDVDTELGDSHAVRVMSFRTAIDFCKKPLSIDVEAVVMASPAPLEYANIYYSIVRAASHKAIPLQLHLLFTLDVEDVKAAMRALIPNDEPRRSFIRRAS
jgi:hypothetical protein